jgi:hypothetical protein
VRQAVGRLQPRLESGPSFSGRAAASLPPQPPARARPFLRGRPAHLVAQQDAAVHVDDDHAVHRRRLARRDRRRQLGRARRHDAVLRLQREHGHLGSRHGALHQLLDVLRGRGRAACARSRKSSRRTRTTAAARSSAGPAAARRRRRPGSPAPRPHKAAAAAAAHLGARARERRRVGQRHRQGAVLLEEPREQARVVAKDVVVLLLELVRHLRGRAARQAAVSAPPAAGCPGSATACHSRCGLNRSGRPSDRGRAGAARPGGQGQPTPRRSSCPARTQYAEWGACAAMVRLARTAPQVVCDLATRCACCSYGSRGRLGE